MSKLAVIQVRGHINTPRPIRDAFRSLNLIRKNSCVVLNNSKEVLGTLVKIKDYVTWGEIDEGTLVELLKKRGRVAGGKLVSEAYLKEHGKISFEELAKGLLSGAKKIKDVPGLKRFFRLNAPTGGFERKGIKTPFSIGGALGYRGSKINDLIRRML